MAPCEFQFSPTNPLLRGSCVSERSRCGAVQIFYVACEPSAEIVCVGPLSLWRRANFLRGPRTLCGDCVCRSALAVATCEFSTWLTNPLRRLRVSGRSRCGAVRIFDFADAPSAVRIFRLCRRTLCGDCACRSALAVAPCESQSSPTNPLRRLCVCVCGVADYPVTTISSRGWQQGRESATNEDTLVTLVKQLETSSCVPAMVVQSRFGPLFLSLCVLHVEPCNVFDTRGKPSALRAETYA